MNIFEPDNPRNVILDSIADGVFTVDDQWRITSFNRAAEKITGVSQEDAIGQYCCDVFRSSICEADCALKKTLSTGTPIVNKALYIVDVHGHRIPISISTAILKDAAGKVIGGVETFRDLSMVEELRKKLEEKYTFSDIIARSRPMLRLFDILQEIADSDSIVLVQGESGTGKELVARAVHNLSPRKDHPFIAVNCGALPDTLLESELFGYRAGAFTDARKDKPGRFAAAEGGTLFLDEIGDISPAMQSRLLRVLQERVFEPLGSVTSVKADLRILAATNKDLLEQVKAGAFREDLFYRINVFRIDLPALRDRREDIPLLVDHFITKFNRLQSKDISGVTGNVLSILMEHDYPGNIRELENIIEHAFVLCRGGLIERRHLPSSLRRQQDDSMPQGSRKSSSGLTLKGMEEMHIRDALRRHGGNRTAASRELGINPSTLFRKLKSLNINPGKSDKSFPPKDNGTQ